MAREIAVYEPEDRRYVENNLFCANCGNTHQWQIDLKLRHAVECLPEGLAVGLEKRQTRKVFKAIESNLYRMVDKSRDEAKDIFKCANCSNGELNLQEQILETCLWTGCPGCWYCGEWLDKEELIDLCSECIHSKKGNIDDDDCFSLCPHYDFGLEQVRHHYGLTLNQLKMDLGY